MCWKILLFSFTAIPPAGILLENLALHMQISHEFNAFSLLSGTNIFRANLKIEHRTNKQK